uniref:Uncharacterized protein n=1 Tax=viral metagenome TaxID=1070528 RepID=A0A6C0I8H5_9ZZZZ
MNRYRLKSWIPLDKINWSVFPSPGAIELLKKYPEKIDLKIIELLCKNPEKIDWKLFSFTWCN